MALPKPRDITVTEGFGTVAVSWTEAGHRQAFIVERRTGTVVRGGTRQPASTREGRWLVLALRHIDEAGLARFVARRYR